MDVSIDKVIIVSAFNFMIQTEKDIKMTVKKEPDQMTVILLASEECNLITAKVMIRP
jgi:hypothetical protein